MTESGPPPVIEVTIAAPVEVVWRSLREPDLIKAWHGWHCSDLDAEVAMIFLDNATADDDAHVLRVGAEDTFSCEEVPGGTRVRVTRPPYRPGEQWSSYYDEVTEGWQTFLQQLRFMHERQPGRPRRTVALMGTGPAAGVSTLWRSTPSPLGEEWFASDRQRGVVLPDLGPGLLITATRPVEDGQVSAMAVLTTYGLDDDAFSGSVRDWTRWWRTAFPAADPAQV